MSRGAGDSNAAAAGVDAGLVTGVGGACVAIGSGRYGSKMESYLGAGGGSDDAAGGANRDDDTDEGGGAGDDTVDDCDDNPEASPDPYRRLRRRRRRRCKRRLWSAHDIGRQFEQRRDVT